MNNKLKEITNYLKGSWAPVELLCEKFNMSRFELAEILSEILAMVDMDIRINNDIVHIS